MENRIYFQFGPAKMDAVLNDSKTAKQMWELLPIESIVNLWGNEIYFETPGVSCEEEGGVDIKPGDIGYWPVGRAMCIFFGPTPLSQGHEIVPAGPVKVIGKILGDLGPLKQVEEREIVKVNKALNKEV